MNTKLSPQNITTWSLKLNFYLWMTNPILLNKFWPPFSENSIESHKRRKCNGIYLYLAQKLLYLLPPWQARFVCQNVDDFFGTVYNLETCRLKTVTQQGDSVTMAYILFFGCMKTKQPEAYTQALPCMIRPRWPGSVTLHAYGPPPSLQVFGCLILPIFLSRFPFTLQLISQQYWIFFMYGISD